MSEDKTLSPALDAMRAAMRQAEEAAAARALAKQRSREAEGDAEMEMLAELALISEPVVAPAFGTVPFQLQESLELETLIARASADVPELENEERDGDLVVVRHEAPPEAWYQAAAEAALPQALRNMVGPVDVKSLLQALLVEIGDVKRTNAILMEQITRVEEKVDRNNRMLKEKRFS